VRETRERELAQLERTRAETERAAVEAQQALVRERAEHNRERDQTAERPETAAASAKAPERVGPTGEEPDEETHHGGAGFFQRRQRRFRREEMVICAVCRRTEAARDSKELEAGGWIRRGELSLCSDCQSKGWQLPDEGSLPFRRSSDRDVVS
jgi:hypothetical protein